jgi:hypothetical protein
MAPPSTAGTPPLFGHISRIRSPERAAEWPLPTPEGVRALGDIGLSVRSYALLNVVIDKVFQLTWFAVGALILWRRSDDGMAHFLLRQRGDGACDDLGFAYPTVKVSLPSSTTKTS